MLNYFCANIVAEPALQHMEDLECKLAVQIRALFTTRFQHLIEPCASFAGF